jgi:hypothetical protein
MEQNEPEVWILSIAKRPEVEIVNIKKRASASAKDGVIKRLRADPEAEAFLEKYTRDTCMCGQGSTCGKCQGVFYIINMHE